MQAIPVGCLSTPIWAHGFIMSLPEPSGNKSDDFSCDDIQMDEFINKPIKIDR